MSKERMFDPDIVYPSDEIGAYTSVEGTIIRVSELLADDRIIDAQTEYGVISSVLYGMPGRTPKIGQEVLVRVYMSGGGFYPDNRVVRWISDDFAYEYY